MYSRTIWQSTTGRIPVGAQHATGRLIRPKRASSMNISRSGRPSSARAAATSAGKFP